MKLILNRFFWVVVIASLLYLGTYIILRGTKVLIHPEFFVFGCDETFYEKVQKDFPQAMSISVESERHQMGGANLISKYMEDLIEMILVPIFYPLEEIEMMMRGFQQASVERQEHIFESSKSVGGAKGRYDRSVFFERIQSIPSITK